MNDALAPPRAATRSPVANVLAFVATVCTTLWAGALKTNLSTLAGAADARPLAQIGALAVAGAPFASALLGILFCHEMGHWLLARAHRVATTLPFFIPMPLDGGVGTLGAVIRIRSALPSRRATLDIGAAGPIAGFLVAVPLLAWGLAHSEVKPLGDALLETSDSGLVAILRGLASGEPALLTGVQHFGDSLLTWSVQRLVVGPLPPGTDLFLHPVAFAAWVGLYVTTLNMLPIGQLDGGHVIYALLGRDRALALSRAVSWGLLAAGLFASWTWLLWWAITRFLVRLEHPRASSEAPLDPGRRWVAVLALVVFAVTFIPVPISL